MKDHHVSLRNSGIAVLAPVCMVFIQDGTSAIVQILCKDNRDIGTLVSLFFIKHQPLSWHYVCIYPTHGYLQHLTTINIMS
mgnify:CR=1 FL=1